MGLAAAAETRIRTERGRQFEKIAIANPKLCRIVTPKLTRYIPHVPTVKQSAFLTLNCQEAFYGGAASGGKSDALLMAALQYVDVPGYAALLLRRTFRELSLPKALLSRAQEWLGPTDAKYSPSKYTWTFPHSGATITFGYLQHEHDVYQYDSAEFQFIGFDELTQFTETQYKFMFGRLRRTKNLPVPLRQRAASNPGGVGHLWVKGRFVSNRKKERIFIKAVRQDNPYIDQEEYTRSLAELDPVTRRQRDEGDWDAEYQGSMFKRPWFHKIQAAMPVGNRKVRFWDCAGTPGGGDFTVGALVSTDDDGLFYVEDIVRGQWGSHDVEKVIVTTAKMDGDEVMVRFEQEPGSSGKAVVEGYVRKLAGWDAKGIPSTGSKLTRLKPFAAQCEAGNVVMASAPWNSEFIDELCTVPNSSHDDIADATGGAFNELTKGDGGEFMGFSFL